MSELCLMSSKERQGYLPPALRFSRYLFVLDQFGNRMQVSDLPVMGAGLLVSVPAEAVVMARELGSVFPKVEIDRLIDQVAYAPTVHQWLRVSDHMACRGYWDLVDPALGLFRDFFGTDDFGSLTVTPTVDLFIETLQAATENFDVEPGDLTPYNAIRKEGSRLIRKLLDGRDKDFLVVSSDWNSELGGELHHNFVRHACALYRQKHPLANI